MASRRMVSRMAVAAILAGLGTSAALAHCGTCGPKKADHGWVSLFNGKDLSGWVVPKKEHNWKVVDGVIDYEAKGGNLVTEEEYGDYILKLEWRFKRTTGKYNAKVFNPDGTQKVDKNGKKVTESIDNADSGIFLRGIGKTQANLWCWPCGSGQLWGYHTSKDPALRKGALPICKADRPVGEWNEMEITMRGTKVRIVLNGKKVIDTNMEGAPSRGPIAFQHHGGFNEKTKKWSPASALIQFRNIKIKELSKKKSCCGTCKQASVAVVETMCADAGTPACKSSSKAAAKKCCGTCSGGWVNLFNGKDLSNFTFEMGKEKSGNDGTWSATDGVIHCTGRPGGVMRTKRDDYSNYTIEADLAFDRPADLKNDADFRGNSGILAHCVPGKGIGVWPRSMEVQGKYRDMGIILPIPRNVVCKRTFDAKALAKVKKPVGQYNTLKVDVRGGDMDIFVNGAQVSTVRDCELTKGYIAFQSEGKPTRWRNIRIKEK